MVVSKKLIKDYGFNTIEEYFNYIIESKINGNFSQVKNLINKLSKTQILQFNNYLEFNESLGFTQKDLICVLMEG